MKVTATRIMWATTDAFHYVRHPVPTDGTSEARVVFQKEPRRRPGYGFR
jgi:hypothetical protein